jgi:hypothetical protein
MAEANELMGAFYDAYGKWEADVEAAAEGEGEFLLSKYTAHLNI